jgi:hypothetical protein
MWHGMGSMPAPLSIQPGYDSGFRACFRSAMLKALNLPVWGSAPSIAAKADEPHNRPASPTDGGPKIPDNGAQPIGKTLRAGEAEAPISTDPDTIG